MYSGVIDFFTDTAGLSGSLGASLADPDTRASAECTCADQTGDVAGRDGVVAHIGGDDLRRQFNEISVGGVAHRGCPGRAGKVSRRE